LICHDEVYGPVEIVAPVLLDLLDSAALGRLRGVYQGGITGLLGVAPVFSRFDHSVGVCLLLRRLGASLEEQVAGLLHDVSHTAFSHVVDFLYNHANQDYHEQLFEGVLAGSDVPDILARHGYDWRDFLDESHYPLLEQPLPHLCADRLDYFLRDALPLGLASPEEVKWFLDQLVVRDGRIGVATPSASPDGLEAARWLGRTFMAADDACWSNLRELGLYQLTAEAMRAGLAAGCLTKADLLGTDRPLWEKLLACEDPAVASRVALIVPETRFILDSAAPDFTLTPKIRAVDPDVWLDGDLRPLSSLDPDFSTRRAAYLARKDRPWAVRVVGK